MRPLLHNESGFSMIELLVVAVILVIIMGGLATIFGIGLNTSKTSNATLASQSGVIVALDRLDFEGRCAQTATRISAGAGVTFSYPSQCTHQGTSVTSVTWCVQSSSFGNSLVRYAGSPPASCPVSGTTWATGVTSPTPFTCTTTGSLPSLNVNLTVNTGTTSLTSATGTDTITLQNATSGAACS